MHTHVIRRHLMGGAVRFCDGRPDPQGNRRKRDGASFRGYYMGRQWPKAACDYDVEAFKRA